MDWQKIGADLAIQGRTQNQARDFANRECLNNFGIKPNYENLISGFNSGIKKFCTPEYSLKFAAEGGIYQGTCPENVEEKVLSQHSSGRVNYLEGTVAKLKRTISDLESEVSRLKSENSDLEAKLRSNP